MKSTRPKEKEMWMKEKEKELSGRPKGNLWAQVQRTSSFFWGENENNVKDIVHMLPCNGL
jgi:hypothetical protein